jgi:uncharacterized protein (DUF362 family)
MEERINRRRVLGWLAGSSVAAAIGAIVPNGKERALAQQDKAKGRLPDQPSKDAPSSTPATLGRTKVAIARYGTPEAMVDAVIGALGGMGAFVHKGDRVLIKPNIGWDRKPEFAANTNPAVVAELVKLCLQAGAKEVKVFDRPCNDPRRSYKNSGIQEAASAAGARVLQLNESRVTRVDLKGEFLHQWEVFDEALKVDVRINVPIAKHHGLAKVTLGMKNWMGCLGGDRSRLHQNIHTSIVDLAAWFKPQLTVLDAYRTMVSNGPTGGRLTDVKWTKTLCASADPVAVDAFGASLFGLNADLTHLMLAEKRGLGSRRLSDLVVQEMDLRTRGA